MGPCHGGWRRHISSDWCLAKQWVRFCDSATEMWRFGLRAGKSGSCGAEPEEYSAGLGIWAGNLCGRSLLRSPGGASTYPCPAIVANWSKNSYPRLIGHAKLEECDKGNSKVCLLGVSPWCVLLARQGLGRGWLVVVKKNGKNFFQRVSGRSEATTVLV